jgi:hypothetical protein
LEFQLRKRGQPSREVRFELSQVGDGKIIGSALWVGADGSRQEWFEVLTIRDGKIVDMQDCRSLREAERFAHSHKSSM